MATNKKGLDTEARVFRRIWVSAVTLAIVLFVVLFSLISSFLAEVIPPSWVPVIYALLDAGVLVAAIRVFAQQSVRAVVWLTWKAALRFKLFVVIAVLLLAAVVGLPLVITDDGTARGFTQILLTYTLTVITALLGLSTLWLACGTLARDIEECQMQMVAVKPIARWQIWLGKWIGIMSLNAALLLLSGVSVYALMQWRAAKLPEKEQQVLRNEIFVARGSAKEQNFNAEIEEMTDRALADSLKKNPSAKANLTVVRQQLRNEVLAELQVVPPGVARTWRVDLGLAKNYLRGQPLYLKVKFSAAQGSTSGTFPAMWQVGVPEKTKLWQTATPMSMAPDTFHEFEIPPDLFDDKGVLTITFANMNNTALLFTLNEGMEVLYREGGFALNFARGMGIIFCWMALLAAVGLAAASFLSFPVAAFFSLGLLAVAMSSGTLATVVTDGTYFTYNSESGQSGRTAADSVIVPVFRAILSVVNLVKDFSPIDSLSTGRSITWWELLRAFGQIVCLLGGLISAAGIFIFGRRELATAQGTQ